MIEQEAVDGPYIRWLREVAARAGDRVWNVLFESDMESKPADAVLTAKGVIRYENSPHYVDHQRMLALDEKTRRELGFVRTVQVTYFEDEVVKVEEEEEASEVRADFDASMPISSIVEGWSFLDAYDFGRREVTLTPEMESSRGDAKKARKRGWKASLYSKERAAYRALRAARPKARKAIGRRG